MLELPDRVLLESFCPLSPCCCRLTLWAATQFSASHHGSGFLVVAKLCGELPFDFLIVHGESWLSGLYEAALSFSRAEHSKAVIWPWQHQDSKAEQELAHMQPRALPQRC